ncbi:Cna protein B-type domain protein [Streptomyces sp. ADI95-16]|uniref:choice-of-anchor A family protein n=1 Tax=Streptomyces sp. ADI95-16 TaxID=1522758 RepID=UPI000F4358D6|nr:choice-of-anchor A family protein [Streptomyces sp. ADI95-16]AYV30052.1 Cna protein B-type domain protein [Streptomyces sp. ADI95-16]
MRARTAAKTGRARLGLGLAVTVAVLATAAPAYPAYPATAGTGAVRATLPGGLGPCLGPECPDVYLDPHTGPANGRDAGINIFVGGDFQVRERAAEAEGRVVVLGSFDQDKADGVSQVYNVGIVGAGSQTQPPAGSDFLTTGGGIAVADSERLIADGGVVRHAGPLSGTGTVSATRVVRDPAAAGPYAPLRRELAAASQCYARPGGTPRTPTGTVTNNRFETLFRGDGRSPLQVFNVDADIAAPGRGQQGIRFADIPANATILVNVLGADRAVVTYSGEQTYRQRLLWNFPDATTVGLLGTGQFQGAALIGNPASRTTVTLPGFNGRFFTTGSLRHTSAAAGGGGQEFHSYPFTGDLPDCGSAPVTGELSVVKVNEAGDALAGAGFELWRESNGTPGLQTGTPGGDTLEPRGCTTRADGICRRTAEPGTYYWREVTPPAGYALPANPVFGPLVLTPRNAGEGVRVRAVNTPLAPPVRGEVSVLKTDAETGDPLAGAVFRLWKESNGTPGLQTGRPGGDTPVGGPCTTDESGDCTRTVGVGTYYWQETAPPPGYLLPANPVFGPLALTEENAREGVTVTAADIAAPVPVPGAVSVRKVSPEGAPLAGAVFQLWRETNGTPGLQTGGNTPDTRVGDDCVTSLPSATCTRTVDVGTYYWRETSAPPGHGLPANPVFGPLVLTADNADQGVAVDAVNTPFHGRIIVVKKDPKTKSVLRGAVFELWKETNGVRGLQTEGNDPNDPNDPNGPDTQVGPACETNRQGVCEFWNLGEGWYYVREVEAPEGYLLREDPVTEPLQLDVRTPDHERVVELFNRPAEDGHHGGKDPGHEHGKDPHEDHGKEHGKDPGKDQGKDQGEDQGYGKKAGKSPAKKPGKSPAKKAGKSHAKSHAKGHGKSHAKSHAKGHAKGHGKAPAKSRRP